MKNGKTLILYMTLSGFLMALWKNLYKERKGLRGFENAVYVQLQKGRALGLGGPRMAYISPRKRYSFRRFIMLSLKLGKYFHKLKSKVKELPWHLAETYGEPLWCAGTGYRNTHLRAVAPTVSNSKLSGNVSPGIEPWAA